MKKYILPILFIILFALNAFATVTVETARVQYSCNGTTTAYTYPFEILEDDDITVITASSAGAESTLVLNTDYTVAGEGTSTGGTVTLTAGSKCASGYTLTMLRNIELQQQTDYVDGASFSAESLEGAIDKQMLIIQQQQESLNRTVKVKKSSTLTDLTVTPDAGKAIGFNAAGTGITTYSTSAVSSSADFTNITDYGATVSAAITAIGATETTVIVDSAINIGGNTTVPANVHLIVLRNGAINTTGYTLTFTGTLDAGRYQIFSGTGTVTGLTESYPEWFGAARDGTTDDATAINNAQSASGNVKFSNGTYLVKSTLNIASNGSTWTGQSRKNTIIKFAPTAADTLLRVGLASGGGLSTPLYSPLIRDMTLTSADTTYVKTGIEWIDVHQGGIENVVIEGMKDSTHASVGLRTYGRDEWHVRDVYIDCDSPVYIDEDTLLGGGTVCGLEYVNFHNFGSAAYAANNHIELKAGMALSSVSMTGENYFSGGTYGIYAPTLYNNVLEPHVSIENLTWDRPEADSGWFIYIGPSAAGNTLNITLRNLNAYTGDYSAYNGYYVNDYDPGISQFENLVFTNSTGDKFGGDLTETYKLQAVGPSAALTNGAEVAYTAIDLSAIVPATAREVWGYASSNAGAVNALISPTLIGTGYVFIAGAVDTKFFFRLPLLTAQTLWYLCGSGEVDIVISGYSY